MGEKPSHTNMFMRGRDPSGGDAKLAFWTVLGVVGLDSVAALAPPDADWSRL